MNKRGMNELGKKRLWAAVQARGGNMKKVSIEAGLGDTYVRDVLRKDRGGRATELAKLAAYLELPLEYLMGELGATADLGKQAVAQKEPAIYIIGKAGAGIWFEADVSGGGLEGKKTSMFPPDPRYPLEAQFDLEVIGTSLDRIARDGDLIRCVDFAKAGLSPQNGDLVIVRRTRHNGSMCEQTAKFYHQLEGRVELRPHSDDPRWQAPLVINGDETAADTIEVTALVVYTYKPISRNRA